MNCFACSILRLEPIYKVEVRVVCWREVEGMFGTPLRNNLKFEMARKCHCDISRRTNDFEIIFLWTTNLQIKTIATTLDLFFSILS